METFVPEPNLLTITEEPNNGSGLFMVNNVRDLHDLSSLGMPVLCIGFR